ncbi:MAG: [Erysipelotrichales bacterium]|nr:[FeFe] hydrogenase, group A [Erysipelotrichales bacterium]
MEQINLRINGKEVQGSVGETILEVATRNHIKIPTLCFLKNCNQTGACRVCVVDVKGARSLVASCMYPISEGMEVNTHNKKVLEARRNTVELILSNHSKNCLSCIRNQNCELQSLSKELSVRDNMYEGEKTKSTYDDVSTGIVRDTSKCILCGRCVSTCSQVQGLGILNYMHRGFETKVGPVLDASMHDVNCMQCGQCIVNCPTGALSEKTHIHEVIQVLNDPSKYVIVQTAPAVRASLGEEFDMPIGTGVTGKMVSALKEIGFDRVYDTNFAADLTIMEEGTEFIDRISNHGVLPMITSCSPGWIRYIEYEYPELLEHLSSCKSPHMMFGAILKSAFAQRHNIDPKDIYVVSIMPCTAKKFEITREEMKRDGIADVDCVLTTRELGQLIKVYGIDFGSLEETSFDQDMFGEYSGAGVIFGTSGGVMEAALRTVYEVLTKEELKNVDFVACRGTEGIKEATIAINGIDVNIAIAHSMALAKPLLEEIKQGTSKYHFIEIMGCPGGCINGGGQSIIPASIKNLGIDHKKLRAQALYEEDSLSKIRKSHENTQIKELYETFLGEPNSHKAHELLHTTYVPRTISIK